MGIGKGTIASFVFIVLLSAALGYVARGSQSATHTITTTSTQTATVVSQANNTITSTWTRIAISQKNYTVTFTRTLYSSSRIPWNSSWYLSTAPGCAGPGGYAPCFSGNLNEAVVFNCAVAAATPGGCTQVVNSSAPPHPSYVITIWFASVRQLDQSPWNCTFSVASAGLEKISAHCILLSATSFIVSQPTPPPT